MQIDRSRYLKKTKINSERALYVNDIVLLTKRTFGSVLGQTKQMTPKEIREIYERAMKWRVNPAALCNSLLKKKAGEIKAKLKG